MGKDDEKSMFHNDNEVIYYISHLNAGLISIIDGDKLQIIKEVEIGSRPNNIAVDEKNNIYIANDRKNEVIILQDFDKHNKSFHMPNNGNIQVDFIEGKIYVCNTEIVSIYSLNNGKKINSIKGFMAADCLKLDKVKKRLFILDILKNEISIYDTLSFNLLKVYNRVGIGASDIIVGENNQYIYVANKGFYRGKNNGSISILDIDSGDISYITLPNGSIITALYQNGNYIYALNNGLHRIEVIDILQQKSINSIKTTLPELQKIKLSPDKKTLIVTIKGSDGRGGVDIIDISSNVVLKTLIFEKQNTCPYDIGILYRNKPIEKIETTPSKTVSQSCQSEEKISILAKRILSTYEEKIIFNEVKIKLPLNFDENFNIEDVTFDQCKVTKQSVSRNGFDDTQDILVIEYDFYIKYHSNLRNSIGEGYVVEGKLTGKQKANLYIPSNINQQIIEFKINSLTELTSTPVIINEGMKFGVNVLVSTKAIIEEIVFIPACKDCKFYKK